MNKEEFIQLISENGYKLHSQIPDLYVRTFSLDWGFLIKENEVLVYRVKFGQLDIKEAGKAVKYAKFQPNLFSLKVKQRVVQQQKKKPTTQTKREPSDDDLEQEWASVNL